MSRVADSLLVVLFSHQGDADLNALVERLPTDVVAREDVDLLCVLESTTEQATRLQRDDTPAALGARVLICPPRLGYGGMQKLAFRYALNGGYAGVVLAPADGQYPPEQVGELIHALVEQEADVVIGSRLADPERARRGHMPWHLRTATGAVASIQNRVSGLTLHDYHSGMRAYRTSFLAEIPFEIDANGYEFDTEILLQALHARVRIVEIPIDVDYRARARRVNRFAFALRVVLATLRYRFHNMGMFCWMQLRGVGPSVYEDKTDVLYSSHAAALAAVDRHRPKTLLDIGCGPGFVAARAEERGARVTGLDRMPPDRQRMSEFVRLDLEQPFPVDAFGYDMVFLLDVIEHLTDPEEFLLTLRHDSRSLSATREPPRLVLSTPNIAFAAVRLNLALGRFNYAARGILDIDHKRLFTRSSLLLLLENCGYDVDRVRPVGAPFGAVLPGAAGRVLGACADLVARVWPTMFAFQFLVVARPRPGLEQLLRDSVLVATGAAGESVDHEPGSDARPVGDAVSRGP